MKHTAAKMLRALHGIVVMLVLVTSITSVPVLAASNGIYIATATPHYRNPVTGVIEDSGGDGSEVLGQSMTESALYRQALVEVDPQGDTYVTIRLKLMDNIESPEFSVDGAYVSASLMQEDYSENTADYRMWVNSEDSVIRCNMYVVPMGREVIFYITVSGLQEGSSDFVTSVTVEEEEPEADEPEPASEPEPAEEEKKEETDAEKEAEAEKKAKAEEKKKKAEAEKKAQEEAKKKQEEEAKGLEEFDASGNLVDEEKTTETDKGGSSALWWIIGGVVVVLAAGGCIWYFVFFKKKK